MAPELDFRYLSAADGDGAVPDMPTAGVPYLAPLPHRAGGHRASPAARVRLYESEGHVLIGKLNGNPVAMFFGEKRLSG